MSGSQPVTLMVGQSGGPTAVINATLAGVLGECRRQPAIGRVLGMWHGIEGALQDHLLEVPEVSDPDLHRLRLSPGAALGSCRYKLKAGDLERLLALFRKHNVRYFLYVGGNDSMDTCHQISQMARRDDYEIGVIGLPKTIDNDLAETDHSPGYASAARFIALATMDAGADLQAMDTFDDVSILEVMGRNAGWLAAASALGKRTEFDPPHLVYVPERPFDEQAFLRRIGKIHGDMGHVFVVVSEGIRDASGGLFASGASESERDAFGHALVTLSAGVGHHLARLITRELGLQARANRPGTIQRSSSALASSVDRDEAERVGVQGVREALLGTSDVMITLQRRSSHPYVCETGTAPLSAVANAEQLVPAHFINETGTGVTAAFHEYALPLIGEPLPVHVRLSRGVTSLQSPWPR